MSVVRIFNATIEWPSAMQSSFWLEEQSDLTLQEFINPFLCARGNGGECTDDVPAVAALGHAPKRKTLHAAERDSARMCLARRRRRYRRLIRNYLIKKMIFINESGLIHCRRRRQPDLPAATFTSLVTD